MGFATKILCPSGHVSSNLIRGVFFFKMGNDEIREAIKGISGVKRIIPKSGKFEPIIKEGYVIRAFDNEDEDLIRRLEDFRDKKGMKLYFFEEGKYKTQTGVRVKSKGELIAANGLTALGIDYIYEPIIDYGEYFSFPDFYLPEYGLVLEHFGMDDDEQYKKSMQRKKRIYAKRGIKWIYTVSMDEQAIEQVLKEKLSIQ